MEIVNKVLELFVYTINHNPMVGMMFLMLIGMSIFAFYLGVFYLIFTRTKNPLIKRISWMFLESLLKLIPENKNTKMKK